MKESATYCQPNKPDYLVLPPPELSPPTIFTYFKPEAEVSFLNKIKDREARSFYAQESLLKTLAEFAGKIPFDQIDFYFDGQNLHHPRFGRLADAFSENNPREKADLAGLEKIEADFKEGANISFWVSPPTPNDSRYGNYGFLWVMVRDNHNLVREHIFRFDEQGEGGNNFANFARSTNIFTKILTQMAPYLAVGADPSGIINLHDEKDFLRTPLSFQVDDPKKVLSQTIFNLFGKDIKKLDEERQTFYDQLLTDPLIGPWLDEYLNYVDWLANSDNKKELSPNIYKPVYDYIQVIFNRARALVRGETSAYNGNFTDSQSLPLAAAFDEYVNMIPSVDGGSCPASTSSLSLSLDPAGNILRKVRVGGVPLSRLDSIMKKPNNGEEKTLHCHCPLCGAEVNATISGGKIRCPACGGEAPYKC